MPIIDNFDTQFIKEATPTADGLMNSYDKTKLDGIILNDIEYIKDGLNEIDEYRIPQFIYGIKIDTTNPDPSKSVVYTDDATGFIPLSVNQTTGVCNYGSWKNFIDNTLGITPCLMKRDGTIISYLNPNNYNQTKDGNSIDIESGLLGQVMIRFKKLYYKFSVDQNKIWFQVSNKKNDSTWIDSAYAAEDGIGTVKKEMYIAAYESVQENNTLQSISNKLPSFKLSFEEVQGLSEFGVFHMMNIVRKQYITFLGYLISKSINLQGNIGNGNTTGSLLKTGTMNIKGLFYGKSTKTDGVKIFGIENLWGNQLEYMNGIIQKLVYVLQPDGTSTPEQHLYIKKFYPYDNIEDFDDVKTVRPNKSGFISTIKFLTTSNYFPENLLGTSTTYFKSYYQNGESKDSNDRLYGLYSGSNLHGDKAGCEFLLLAYTDKKITEVTTHIIY